MEYPQGEILPQETIDELRHVEPLNEQVDKAFDDYLLAKNRYERLQARLDTEQSMGKLAVDRDDGDTIYRGWD